MKRIRNTLLGLAMLVAVNSLPTVHAAMLPVLKGVQFQPTQQGMKVTLNLSSIPADLKVQDSPSGKTQMVFSGKLSPQLKGSAYQFRDGSLRHIAWIAKQGKIHLTMQRLGAFTSSIYPLHHPERIVIGLVKGTDKPVTAPAPKAASAKVGLSGQEVAPGVIHTKMVRSTSRGPVAINILEVDPKNPYIDILPALANTSMKGKAQAETIVRRNNAIAGVNASYFKPDVGIPLGTLIINEELVTGPLYDRVALGITRNQDLKMERISLRGSVVLPDGTLMSLNNVNQPRVAPSQRVIYTYRWGNRAPKVPANGIQVQLRGGHVTGVSTTVPLAIPEDGYVISGPVSSAMVALAGLSRDKTVGMSLYTVPDWSDVKHAIGGGPYLVKDGRVYVDTKAQRISLSGYAPRTAAGITQDGKLLLVTVDGRQRNSVGVSLAEMAHLMRQLGAVNAMNFDGGSSTQMVVGGRLVNSPSVAHGVSVSNCLIIRRTSNIITSRDSGGSSSAF